MAFVLLHFAISAVGRLEIQEISAPLSMMLERIYVYLPKLLVGGVLMAIGVVVARIAGNVAAHLLAAMGFNTLMVHIGLFKQVSEVAKRQEQESKALVEERMHASEAEAEDEEHDAETPAEDEFLSRTGSGGLSTPADIAGVLVAAVIVLLFLRQMLGTMGLDGLARMLDGLLAFLPNVLVAVVLVGAGLWAGRWSHARLDELTKQSSDRLLKATGNVAHVAVVAFAAMMALQQLGVGRQLIAIAFALLLGSVCLAAALAFGLGGREVAGRILSEEYSAQETPAGRVAPAGPERAHLLVARSGSALLAGGDLVSLGDHRLDQVAVHASDKLDVDALRTRCHALVVVGAVAESLGIHLRNHLAHPVVALGLPLRQKAEVRDLGRHEQHRRRVGACRDASTATDALGGIHGAIRILFRDQNLVRVPRGARTHRNVAAGLDDAVECAAVDDQILDHGERIRAPGLQGDLVAVFEVPHVKLAGGGRLLGAVSAPVDDHTAHPADAFTAIVVEGDGILVVRE